MKLIKLKDKYLLLSDEEIKEGDKILSPNYEIQTSVGFKTGIGSDLICWIKVKETTTLQQILNSDKIIAGIYGYPKVDLSDLKEEDCKEIGYVKLGSISLDYVESIIDEIPNVHGIDNKQIDLFPLVRTSWIAGFKQAQSLNDKQFSLEQMEKAIEMAREEEGDSDNTMSYSYLEHDIIQSLQKTEWDVEVEMEDYLTEELALKGSFKNLRPKITNNSIKVIKIL